MEKFRNHLRYVIIWCVVWAFGCSLGATTDMAWSLWMVVARQDAGTGKDPLKRLMAARKPKELLVDSNGGWQVCKRGWQVYKHNLMKRIMAARKSEKLLVNSYGGWQVCKHDSMQRIMAARKPEKMLMDSNGGWQVCKHDPMKRIMAARKPNKILMDFDNRWQVRKHGPETICRGLIKKLMASKKEEGLSIDISSGSSVCKHVPETICKDEISLLIKRKKLNSQGWKYVMTSRLIVIFGNGWPKEVYIRLSKSASTEEVGLVAKGSKKRKSQMQMLEIRYKMVSSVRRAHHENEKEALCVFMCVFKQKPGLYANQVTFVSCLSACIRVSMLEYGVRVHSDILKSGYEAENIEETSLMEMYDAYQVFINFHARDVVYWELVLTRSTQHVYWINKQYESAAIPVTAQLQQYHLLQLHVEALAAFVNAATSMKNDAPLGGSGMHGLGGSVPNICCVSNGDVTNAGRFKIVGKQQIKHLTLGDFCVNGLQFAAHESIFLKSNLEFLELGMDEAFLLVPDQDLLMGDGCTIDAGNTYANHAQS